MKKTYRYILILALFGTATSFILIKAYRDEKKKTVSNYNLQPRNAALSNTEEWSSTRNRALALQQAIRNNPDDVKSLLALASLFLQEARITGNYMYYDMAALQHVNTVLGMRPSNFEAITLKAMILLSQHHFSEGLALAEKAQALNPHSAFVYGIMVDGNVEMGNYNAAIANADKMVSIRPDIRSYSRIAYLREIFGDYDGAIEAMKLAINAGAPGDETTAWCRVQLGKLYEATSDWKDAEMNYLIALEDRPNYAHALAGLARTAIVSREYPRAIALYQQADSLVAGYTYREELANLYQLAGQIDKAESIDREIISRVTSDAQRAETDESIGHYADLELAYAFLKVKDTDKALAHALLEYNRRPGNIEVNEALAWVYYRADDLKKAIPHLKTALQTNSKNPRLLCRAGLIFAKAGDIAAAKPLLSEGLKSGSMIDPSLKMETEQLLKTL